MEIREVKQQIKQGALEPLYIFTGEEIEAQRIYINKMAEVTGREVVRCETVADVIKVKDGGFIKVKRLFVVRDDADFIKAESAWDNITDVLGDRVLVLQLTTADKRTKFYKRFQDKIVTFNYMSEDVLYKYSQRACEMSEQRAEQLVSVCRGSYGRLLLEADKVNQYAESERVTTDTAFDVLIADGTIHKPPEDAIFDFVDAVLKAKPQLAYRLLADCKAIGEPSLRLISVLYSNIKRVLQVQTCNSTDICKSTGLSAWDVKCARRNVGFWSGEDLVYFLKVLQKVEKKIKMGEIEDAIAIDFALTHIF